jgi:galactokinase
MMIGVSDKSSHGSSAALVTDCFKAKFGATPSGIFRAPGRVNLIGEHTDYNDGFVMPVALEFCTYAAIGPRDDGKLRVYSENLDELRTFDLADLRGGPTAHWSDYVLGVAAVLQERAGTLSGANLAIRGEVPIGSGLSSSAALEVATALAILATSGVEMDLLDVAKCCQQAENEYTGARCGIMDQFVACFGKSGYALMLDCRTLKPQLFPIKPGVSIVICNSKVRHQLAAGEYNARRADCEESVRRLRRFKPEISALRDVSEAELDMYRGSLPEIAFRRCLHVVTENVRVREGAQMLQVGDLSGFGDLMYESHRSLRDLYEVSCRELDILVDLAEAIDGVYGARMTGGGFGGCTVNLVKDEALAEFKARITPNYEQRIGVKPDIYVCAPGDGAGAMEQRSDDPLAQPQSWLKA